MKLVILLLVVACTLFLYNTRTGYLSDVLDTKQHDFETPENYVGTDSDFYRFLIKTCEFAAEKPNHACVDNMMDIIQTFGVDSPELQKRAIYWSGIKTSPDDLLTGHSDLKELPPRNLITNANYVGNVPEFNNFLLQVCGLTTEHLDQDCFDGMVEPYYRFGVESLQVQARAVYWNYKKAEEAARSNSQTITYNSLRCITPVVQHLASSITPVVQHLASSITPVVQHLTSSPHVTWIVIVLALIAFYLALARLTRLMRMHYRYQTTTKPQKPKDIHPVSI